MPRRGSFPNNNKNKEKIMSNPRSFITPGHVRAYQMLTSSLYTDNLTLTSCYINGEPGVAIVLVDEVGENKVAVMPLFVAITPQMKLAFVGEEEGSGDGEGGGPRRADANTVRQFNLNKEALEPGGST
jgi:hypothetical protein